MPPPISKTLLVLAASALWLSPVAGLYADGATAGSAPVATNSTASIASAPAKPAPAKKQITGAELYSIHCNRCHQERYPTERTGAQWRTIMLHMQVRANIPVSQAKLILQYLQENSGR
jgi:cytochrome c5